MKQCRLIQRVGRLRRVLGWVLAGLGVVIATAWLASGWGWTQMGSGRWHLWTMNGALFYYYEIGASNSWFIDGGSTAQNWIFSFRGLPTAPYSPFGSGPAYSTLPAGPGITAWTLGPLLFFARSANGTYVFANLIVVYWPAPLLLWGLAALLLRSGIRAGRRARGGRCLACGYDIGGLMPGVACPECGKFRHGSAS